MGGGQMLTGRAVAGVALSFLLVVNNAAVAQESANAALQSCMNKTAAAGTFIGALGGAVLGALVGEGKDRGKSIAIGATTGALLGGATAWFNSWQSCSKDYATAESFRTADYQQTSQRLNYDGRSVLLKIEEANMPPTVRGQDVLPVFLRYVVLTPDAREVQVSVDREMQCRDSSGQINNIPMKRETYTVQPGTIESSGNILIPAIQNEVGTIHCEMNITVRSGDAYESARGPFQLLPG